MTRRAGEEFRLSINLVILTCRRLSTSRLCATHECVAQDWVVARLVVNGVERRSIMTARINLATPNAGIKAMRAIEVWPRDNPDPELHALVKARVSRINACTAATR